METRRHSKPLVFFETRINIRGCEGNSLDANCLRIQSNDDYFKNSVCRFLSKAILGPLATSKVLKGSLTVMLVDGRIFGRQGFGTQEHVLGFVQAIL